MRTWKNIFLSNLLLPVLVILTLAISYGIQSGRLGFYLDDWIILESYAMGGAERLAQYTFLGNRPLIFPFWLLGFLVSGTDPMIWQIWSLVWRAAAVIVIWLGWRKMLPDQPVAMGLAALLCAVYPIFDQQASSLTFSFHWMTLTLWGLSFYLMLCATKSPRKWTLFTALALLLFSLQIYAQEFFIGLEILRPVALWWMFKGQSKQIKKTILQEIPWALSLSGYLIWRLKFMPTPATGDRNVPIIAMQLISNPLKGLVSLTEMTAQSLLEGLGGVWYRTIEPLTFSIGTNANFISWIAATSLFTVACVLIWRTKPTEEKLPTKNYWLPMLVFGLLFFLGGIAPGVSKGSYFTPANPTSDRFAMAAMPGAALIVTSLVWLLIHSRKAKIIILSLLISLSVGFQFRLANSYRHSWEKQERLYWQLAWRAPQVQEQTAFLGNGALALGMGNWATASALNLLYGDYENPQTVPYWYVDLYRTSVENPDPSLDFESTHLNYTWDKNRSIVFQYEPEISPCLWVLDKTDDSNPDLDEYVRKAVLFSNLSLINAGKSPIDSKTLGKEPDHEWWCYYYQVGALAAQMGQWEEALSQLKEAEIHGQSPYASSEYMPFIKAAGFSKDWELATNLSQEASFLTGSTSQICMTWKTIQQSQPLPNDVKNNMVENFGCTNLK